MGVVVDVKFNEYAREYAAMNGHTLEAMAEHARANKVTGFGLIKDNYGEPLVYHDDLGSFRHCDCRNVVNQANFLEASSEFNAAGVGTYMWNGLLVYDASKPLGRDLAREMAYEFDISPCLNHDRLSDLKWEYACVRIDEQNYLPPGVSPDDVLEVLPDVPYCWRCTTYDIHAAMAELGYVECQRCDAFVQTDSGLTPRVCYLCAVGTKTATGCTCVRDRVNERFYDSLSKPVFLLTEDEIKQVQAQCDVCSTLV